MFHAYDFYGSVFRKAGSYAIGADNVFPAEGSQGDLGHGSSFFLRDERCDDDAVRIGKRHVGGKGFYVREHVLEYFGRTLDKGAVMFADMFQQARIDDRAFRAVHGNAALCGALP